MRDIILESIKKVRMFETRVLSEALTPEEEKELQSIAQEVIGTVESGVDGIPPEVIKAVNDYKSSGKTDSPSNKPTDKPTDKPTGTGKVGPANPGTRAIQHYLNTKHGQKLDVDGRDGPLTTAAIRSLSQDKDPEL